MTAQRSVRLTTAQALVRFLAVQYAERDGRRHRLIAATWGIFGHGNVAGIGQALLESGPEAMPFLQGRNEQAMVHAAVGYARQRGRLSAHAVTTSIGPGATNLVTGAALATINRIPVLLLPGDTFATRPADPVLQQLEVPWAGDVSVNDTLRPVSRYFDRITRPEALVPAALQAMRVLTDPVQTGAVTLALPQDVQAEAYDWPEEFFAERVWRVRRPRPGTDELRAAAEAVRAARRPLLVVGGGIRHSGAEDALRAFADATGIPVAATQAGKGALRHDHPAEVGAVGHTGTATADDLARAADLVIAAGTRLTDFTTASSTLFQDPGVRFLGLNLDPYDAHKQAALPLVADAREGLDALRAELAGHRVDPAYERTYRKAKLYWEALVDQAFHAPDEDAVPTQAQVLGALDARRRRHRRDRQRGRLAPRRPAPALAGPLRVPVPRGVRLLLHGLRDPRRPRRGPRRPGAAGVGARRRRLVPDEPHRDRHRRPGGRPPQGGDPRQPRLRLHRRPLRGGRRRGLRHGLPLPGARRRVHRGPPSGGPRGQRGLPRDGRDPHPHHR
ncbi:IolD protein [Streptomyces sp. C]|nr:IolD protein [Streptomyces sp. C]